MSYYDYYKPKKKKIDPKQKIDKMLKKNPGSIEPVIIEGTKIAKTWWGLAWIQNLERYADYENRISRGKSYVRSGSVIDLRIGEGLVTGVVQGTRIKPYEVSVSITPLNEEKWNNITKKVSENIDGIEALLEGRFPDEMKELLTMEKTGIFPSPREISFNCSCPDWASMCKHVAAVLYGIGARLDKDPGLFFKLRRVDINDLISRSLSDNLDDLLSAGKTSRKSSVRKPQKSKTRVIDESEVSELFDL